MQTGAWEIRGKRQKMSMATVMSSLEQEHVQTKLGTFHQAINSLRILTNFWVHLWHAQYSYWYSVILKYFAKILD